MIYPRSHSWFELVFKPKPFKPNPLLFPDAKFWFLGMEVEKSIVSFWKRQGDDILQIEAMVL